MSWVKARRLYHFVYRAQFPMDEWLVGKVSLLIHGQPFETVAMSYALVPDLSC